MQPRTLEFLKKELNWKAQKPDTKFEFTPKELAKLLEKYLKDFTAEFPGTYNDGAKYDSGSVLVDKESNNCASKNI